MSRLCDSHFLQNPVSHSQYPAYSHAIQDHRPGDGKYLYTDTENLAFGAEFHCGSSYGISKAGDGYKGSGSAEFYQFLVNVKTGT